MTYKTWQRSSRRPTLYKLLHTHKKYVVSISKNNHDDDDSDDDDGDNDVGGDDYGDDGDHCDDGDDDNNNEYEQTFSYENFST